MKCTQRLILLLIASSLEFVTFPSAGEEITFLVTFRYPPEAPQDIRSKIEIFEGMKPLNSAHETQRNRQVVCRVAPSPSTTAFLLKFETNLPRKWVIDYTEPMEWANPGGNVGEKLIVNRQRKFNDALEQIEQAKASDLESAQALLAEAKRYLPNAYSEEQLRYARAERMVLEWQSVPRIELYNAFAAATSDIKTKALPPALSLSLVAERYDLLISSVVSQPQQAGDPKTLAEGLNRKDITFGEAQKPPDEEWRDILKMGANVDREVTKAGKNVEREVGRFSKDVARDVAREAARTEGKVSVPAAKKAGRWMKRTFGF